jgi:hypothetical protein
VPGYDAAVGLSAKDRASVITELQKPTTINTNGVPSTVPAWQAMRGPNGRPFTSIDDAVQATTAMANTHNLADPRDVVHVATHLANGVPFSDMPAPPSYTSTGTADQWPQHKADALAPAQPGAPGPTPGTAPPGAQAPGSTSSGASAVARLYSGSLGQQPAPVAPGATAPAPQSRGPAPSATAPNPQAVLAQIPPEQRQAYSDPAYQLPSQGPVRPGVGVAPEVQQTRNDVAKAASTLLDDQSANAKAAGAALRYYALAKDVLDSGNVTTGWSQEKLNQTASALQQFGIKTSMLGDPSKSAELVKALTNAGLQNLKTVYGARITQSEVFLNLQHANPAADMPLPALQRLIGDQVDNLKYDLATAQRARPYLATGNDPRSFDDWNQKHFPREQLAVTPQAGGAQPSGGGGGGAPSAALAALRANPARAPEFKAKYGYLPPGVGGQ